MNTVQGKVLARMRRASRKVHISKDFLDLGSRSAVDLALFRLVESKAIQRISRGLYHIPRMNPKLGIEVAPGTNEIAQALARRTGSRVIAHGAVAANALGLSTQVPAKPFYLTDGRTRRVRLGNSLIILKHVSPKDLPFGSPTSAMVFQALLYMGREAIGPEAIRRLRRTIPQRERRRLLKDAHHVTDWVAAAVRKICTGDESSGLVRHG